MMCEFECKGQLMVTDPCYFNATDMQSLNDGFAVVFGKPGTWTAYSENDKNGEMVRVHIATEGKVVNNTKYVVGVDSGTLAVFDYDFYRKNYQCVRDADYNNWEGIYRKMCDKLEELPNYSGMVAYENRCVDITGFGGDGGYDAEFGFDKDGWCVEIVIHFYGDTEWYDQYDAEEEIEESF